MTVYDFPLAPLDERMYIIIGDGSAIVIDPSVNSDAIRLLRENAVNETFIFLTHEHFDHITGVETFRQMFKTSVICSDICAERICSTKYNLSSRFEIFYLMNHDLDREEYSKMCNKPFTTHADITYSGGYSMNWCGHTIQCIVTPGHSPGSSCIIIDEKHVFTGDSLVNGFDTITRYPGGNKKDFENITLPFLRAIEPDVMIYPGHGDREKKEHWNI